MTESKILFALLRHQICGEKVGEDVIQSLTPELLEGVYQLANAHDLAHLAGQALSQLGVLGDDEISQIFKKTAIQAAYRYVQINFEYEQICITLEQAKIPFIPLKGSVLRNYYPEPWMRTSSDIDILVKPENLEAAIKILVDSLDYVAGEAAGHDVPLHTKTGLLLELHFDTVEHWYAGDRRHDMLKRIWEYADNNGSGYHYYLSDEMFYFYHIAHMSKHFKLGGCGIRTFMDIWIMNHKMGFDPARREEMLKEGNLYAFGYEVEKLSESWFSGLPMDNLTLQIGQFVLEGGSFGNLKNRVMQNASKETSKVRYLWNRLFLPYSMLCEVYPVLKKHRWLTPLFHPVRWAEMLLRGDLGRSFQELKIAGDAQVEQRDAMAQMLRELDI